MTDGGGGDQADQENAYTKLLRLLDGLDAEYRLIDHTPEGRTDLVSAMRGHPVEQAAKCMVVMVKVGKKVTRFVLAVVPGDKRVDLNAIKTLMRGTFIRFADTTVAEGLAGNVSGTVLPVSFHERLELIVDPGVLENEEIFFNAGRLDRSMALRTKDYVKAANPRVERVAG